MADLTVLASACRKALDAPPDLPLQDLALEGLEIAIRLLATTIPGLVSLANRISEVRREKPLGIVDGATQLALQRRLGRHGLYAAAIALARAVRAVKPDVLVVKTLGARFALRLFEDKQPSRTAMASTIAAIESPAGKQSLAWTNQARARAFNVADRKLREAIERYPQVAIGYGILNPGPCIVRLP